MISAEVTLTQPEGNRRQFVTETGGGHFFLMDDDNGATGPKPIEMVAAAIAGCTAFDVISILRKKRQQISGLSVRVAADQAAEPPKVFTDVRITYIVTGTQIDPKAVEDAIHLSETKYCSVGAMIAKSAKITTSYEIHEKAVPAEQPA